MKGMSSIAEMSSGLRDVLLVRPAGAQPLNLGVSIALQVLAAFTSDPSSRSDPFLRCRPSIPVRRLTRISENDFVSEGTVCPVTSANGLAA